MPGGGYGQVHCTVQIMERATKRAAFRARSRALIFASKKVVL
jgi:hypothetical protein